MPSKREASAAKTVPLRKAAATRDASAPVTDLGALDGHLGYLVRRLQVWIFQDFIRKLSRLALSPAQFSVLAVISANKGLSQAEVGNTLGIERARLVRLLNRMERRGLVERQPSAADGRRHALRLTRTGHSTLKRAEALADRHEADLVAKLGVPRYRMLTEALRDI